jgi:RNA polymerase sigma-70 factor (ECF subfamily)
MHQEAPKFSEQDSVAVGAVRAGDPERYRELVERHHRRVYAVAWSRLGDPTLAEEVTQEAFIRAYRRLWMLGDGEKFAPWVSSIARRLAINSGLRHRRELSKRERWALEQALPEASSPQPEDTDASCSPETLGHWLAELAPAHRECLVLFYLEGKSGAEAAAALGIKESALRVRLHRARSVLRERIEEHLGDSLKRLTPTRLLVPAILAGVLDSPSAQAAAAGGTAAVGVGAKLLTSAGKFLPFSAMVAWFPFVFLLPGFLLGSWLGRLEHRNFRDAQGFRADNHRRFQRSLLWGIPLGFLAFLVLFNLARSAGGSMVAITSVAVFLAALTLVGSRSLMIQRNPFQLAMFANCCVVTLCMLALGLEWLPSSFAMLPSVAGSAVFLVALKWRPARMDYSLFLRARQGLLRVLLGAEPMQLAAPLNRTDLMHFARFLGSRWLISWYRWDPQGIMLRLPPVRSGFFRSMVVSMTFSINPRTSHVLLRKDGTVVAHCGEGDLVDLVGVQPNAVLDLPQLEREVAESVTHAWRAFREGDVVSAAKSVGEIPESDIFVVPPARSCFSRWTRIILGANVTLLPVLMVSSWRDDQLRMVHGRDLKPVAVTEAAIRVALDPQWKQGASASNALPELNGFFGLVTILPDQALFTSNHWVAFRRRLVDEESSSNRTPAERLDHLLGSRDMVRFCANGWFSPEDFGLTPESIRHALRFDLIGSHRRWFVPPVAIPVSGDSGQPVEYSVLDTDWVDQRIQCLQRFGCLDAVDGSAAIESIIQHQVLSDRLPEGRRRVRFPQLLHGLFHTFGMDPISDTYHALVILECFGALDRVNREACIQGILRFHHGRGLFGSVRTKDGFFIQGDAHDTIWAFESLRMLGALDRVPDISQWQFRPAWFYGNPAVPSDVVQMSWFEIEAWVCQQRLSRIVAERERNPSAPVRSLMEP